MIDYFPPVNYEYVAYVDDDFVMPIDSAVVSPWEGLATSNVYTDTRHTDVTPSYWAVQASDDNLPAGLPSAPAVAPVGTKYVYWWIQQVVAPDGSIRPADSTFILYRTWNTAPGAYEFVSPGYQLNEGIDPGMPAVPDGVGVTWLYALGQKLTDVAYDVNEMLTFGVGDYNFFFFLLQGGFYVYMGWVIVKFVVGI